LAILLVLCGGPSLKIRIPEAEVEQDLRRAFPVSRTYAGIAEVTLRNPTLLLGQSKNRLTVGVDAVVSPRALGGIEVTKGAVTFSAGLSFDNKTARFRLENVTVDSVGLPLGDLDQQLRRGITEVIRTVLRENLEDAPVHQLNPRGIRTPIARLFLRDVTIQEDAIVVTLGF
jgi:hypothetical protein